MQKKELSRAEKIQKHFSDFRYSEDDLPLVESWLGAKNKIRNKHKLKYQLLTELLEKRLGITEYERLINIVDTTTDSIFFYDAQRKNASRKEALPKKKRRVESRAKRIERHFRDLRYLDISSGDWLNPLSLEARSKSQKQQSLKHIIVVLQD